MTPPHVSATPAPARPVLLREPAPEDGTRMWEITRDTGVLDVNSAYAYVLLARDFAATSVVVEADGRVVAFITGYRRPRAPDTLFVWQVGVDADQRGLGLAGRMLDELMDRLADDGVTHLETTVSPDNDASIAMFTALARRRQVAMARTELFTPEHLGVGHQPEDLYTIGARAEEMRTTTGGTA